MSVATFASRFEGLPIHWGSQDVALLQEDGQIQILDAGQIRSHQILTNDFCPQSLQQARAQLQSELGERFETMITGPYLIAAPRGQVERWEKRFQSLFSGYLRYFQSRGWQINSPDFPLVIIVLGSREEFLLRVSREVQEGNWGDNLAGMYIPRSNRCLIYQMQGNHNLPDWRATEQTIAHEAIHQLAYNTGIHQRLFQHPLWFVEGLATMFELPTVYESNLISSDLRSRIHIEKLSAIREANLTSEEFALFCRQLIQKDDLFRTQPKLAYAVSWGLTFYLVERRPNQYSDYITIQRQRGFQKYEAVDRELDFRQAFGADPDQLAHHVLHLLTER
jgi:hypothetical protein